jgi:hypothetical protein
MLRPFCLVIFISLLSLGKNYSIKLLILAILQLIVSFKDDDYAGEYNDTGNNIVLEINNLIDWEWISLKIVAFILSLALIGVSFKINSIIGNIDENRRLS